jgi:transcriptional regulator with XRE-family HTH domain
MYQYEKRLDCHALGQEIKRRRKAKGWTQEHLAQLVDLTPRSIMYKELIIIEGAAEGIRKARETEGA